MSVIEIVSLAYPHVDSYESNFQLSELCGRKFNLLIFLLGAQRAGSEWFTQNNKYVLVDLLCADR